MGYNNKNIIKQANAHVYLLPPEHPGHDKWSVVWGVVWDGESTFSLA